MDTLTHDTVDTTAESFEQDVIGQSRERLVLVDFWAAWCGPCKALTPILDRLLEQYRGAVCLVKVNTDEQQDLAGRFGIRSLPTVLIFRDGQVVDQFMGVQPESAIKQILDKHVVRESDLKLEQAIEIYAAGDTDRAIAMLRQAIAEDVSNDRPKFTLAQWLLDLSRLDEAEVVLDSVSRDGKTETQFRSLAASLEFAGAAASDLTIEELAGAVEQNENDHEKRYLLAQRLVHEQRYAEALDHLLEIIKRDRSFNDDAPRKTMLKIFEIASEQAQLVSRYRGLLARALN